MGLFDEERVRKKQCLRNSFYFVTLSFKQQQFYPGVGREFYHFCFAQWMESGRNRFNFQSVNKPSSWPYTQ